VVESGDLSQFKRNPNYTAILEHVNRDQGEAYLFAIRLSTKLSTEEIRAFCAANDSIGSPSQCAYGDGIIASPSSLRYIYHAHLILSHMASLRQTTMDVVEIGGGYGGLCFALHWFAPAYGILLNSYSILDLEQPLRLQQKVLEGLNRMKGVNADVQFYSAATFGKTIPKKDLFLVSNYCFSEIDTALQTQYRQHLFPKVSHGFMAWNMIPLYPFGFQVREEEEVPKTGPFNKYVYF
jgi:hypothetical protein